MVLTTEAVYVVTTAKKGTPIAIQLYSLVLTDGLAAKHLEPLKGGKIPVEILVTTKDQEQKTKSFEKCVEAIKGAGVSLQTHILQAEA
jgi:hypothetical protein